MQTTVHITGHATGHTAGPDAGGGCEAITTFEDLGRHLQGLRVTWRVTQESLSTKTGAITERKISRSRISEIENAKRDPVTERELRVYMRGLKCTPRHIDQVVKVLTQCTTSPAKESSTSPHAISSDATNPATLEAYPAGLGGVDDDLAPLTAKAASRPRLSRLFRRWWRRHGGVFVAATALVAASLAGLGIGCSLRGESGDRTTLPRRSTALLVPHGAPLIAEDTADLIKDATFPAGAPLRANQRLSEVSEGWNRLADYGDVPGRDATQQLVKNLPVLPCGVTLAGPHWPGTAPQCRGGAVAEPGSVDERDQRIPIDPGRTYTGSGAMRGGLLEVWERDCCVEE